MARLTVPATGQLFTEAAEICRFLKPFDCGYARWDTGEPRVANGATSAAILDAYEPEIAALKNNCGYVTADVVDILPDTPGLDEMLAKFSREHTHSEDEVRFCIRGKGIFHINPVTAPVFAIEMEAGDLIKVPSGIRHWFNLCPDKSIRVIRLFLDPTGWTPHYVQDRVDQGYEPLCFSELQAETVRHKSVVQP